MAEATNHPSRVLAKLHLHGAGEWPHEQRRKVSLWLRRQAALLETQGDDYGSNYRARYRLPKAPEGDPWVK